MIVVGLDGSRTSWRAASYADGLARRQRYQVTVVYVVSPGALAAMTAAASATIMAAETREQIGAGLREQVERLAAERGIDTEFLVVRGDPVTELREWRGGAGRRARRQRLGAGRSPVRGLARGPPGEGCQLACDGRAVATRGQHLAAPGGLAEAGVLGVALPCPRGLRRLADSAGGACHRRNACGPPGS